MSRSRYTILTCQARIPAAHSNLPEVPAGMLDGSGNFKGVAAEEIQEECHIVISEDELIDLTALAYGDRWRGMYPSAGVRACVWTGDDVDGRRWSLRVLQSEGGVLTKHHHPCRAAMSSSACTCCDALSSRRSESGRQ
jgi:hypothetical protein